MYLEFWRGRASHLTAPLVKATSTPYGVRTVCMISKDLDNDDLSEVHDINGFEALFGART